MTRRGLAIIAGIVTSSLVACTQVTGPNIRSCDTLKIALNSGFDHLESTPFAPQLHGLGEADQKWLLLEAPEGIATPRRLTAVTFGNWAEDSASSRWLGPYPEGTEVATTLPWGTYTFLYCFCLCDGSEDVNFLRGRIRSSGGGAVEVNGTPVADVPDGGNSSAGDDWIQFQAGSELEPGLNCIRIETRNETPVGIEGSGKVELPVGINVTGLVATVSCCEGQGPGAFIDDALLGAPLNEASIERF